jgi:hypothetical protein
MQQLDNLQSATSLYESQIRVHALEGSFAPGTPAHDLLMQRRVAPRTQRFWDGRFRGTLKIDGLKSSLPDQDFSFHFTETGGYIENHPTSHWPFFRIDLTFNPINEQLEIKSFHIVSANNTVEAGLFYTRVVFAIYTSGNFHLQENRVGNILKIIIDKLSLSEKEVLSQAKAIRKLKFIESIFDVKFLLPKEISVADASQIEMIFRGITEGKVTVRSGKVRFYDYTPSADELNDTPFTEPGPFTHKYSDKYELSIFDQQLPVGSITIHLERAAVANQRVLDSLRNDERQSVNLRLVVFDHQVTYCFEKYVGQSQYFRRKMEQLMAELLREEPTHLARSLTDSLSENVAADEARQVVTGWLQFYDFPDRFCPQEPKLEKGRWRVPIWMTYPHGQGGWVQDAFVDLKTGVVTVPVSVEELRKLGKSVAAEVLRAS